jgi:poly(hydroxyalkanoate) depolymerase family esterase
MTASISNHKESMHQNFEELMLEATRLTRAGQLGEATAAIQRALGGASHAATTPAGTTAAADALLLDGCVIELPADVERPAEIEPRFTGDFGSGSHTHGSLTRGYKLYVPPDVGARALPLVVMLHGCTQDPDDFAAGTGMNERAQEQGFFVLYPEQAQDANPARCWNWFKHNHQRRDRGEAAVIATMTQSIVRAHGIDPERVYIAGLSAGGVMAAQVACAYPELFAAVGVHSGLPPGVARSLPGGLAAMKGDAGEQPPTAMAIPVIVFHGDNDATVHPRNAASVVDAVLRSDLSSAATTVDAESGTSLAGQRYTRSCWRAGNADVIAEHWLVHGGGHAWFGGRREGSYTDVRGPDASGEMLRFFLARRCCAGAAR